MKKVFALLCLCCLFCPAEEPLKVLMIGNSFSVSVYKNLKDLAFAQKSPLILIDATIGGCSMEKHVQMWKKSQEDPEYRPYGTHAQNLPGKPKASLQELLAYEKYDIVTIQQASHESWIPESFSWAKELIEIVRNAQPKAEIVIQQTWSYRSDSPRFQKWNIDQDEMYKRLTENYTNLAKEYNFRIIPMGLAVQLYRKYAPGKYVPMSKAQLAKLKEPEVPPTQEFDAAGNTYWGVNKKDETKTRKLISDYIHLNPRGQLLQAYVWYSFLFKKPADQLSWISEPLKTTLKPEELALIKKCATEAIQTFPQVAK